MTDATVRPTQHEHRLDDAPFDLDDLDCAPLDPSASDGATVDCSQIIARLHHFLDRELSPERTALIQGHLDRCLPCLEAFDFHAELKLIVQARCREDVPSGLLERIAAALHACDPEG